MKIKYTGKALLIEEKGKRILVAGDLHLGYGGALRESGNLIIREVAKEIKEDFERIFLKIGRVGEVVLLGDLKHVFGGILREEWKEVVEILEYLKKKCDKIVIVKGNHDVILGGMIKKMDRINIKLVDYYIDGRAGYIHGDKDFKEIHEKNIKMWVIGHGHPAVWIKEGVKREKYKCFLEGGFEGRKVIILPSFFPFLEGSDPIQDGLKLAWNFDIEKFKVLIVDGLGVRDFGVLGELGELVIR